MKKTEKQAARLLKRKRDQLRGISRRRKRESIKAVAPLRKFRNVMFGPNASIALNSDLTGEPVKIHPENLNRSERRILSMTCDFIEAKLAGTEYEEPMQIMMKVAVFCSTKSKHLGAYCGTLGEYPVVVLNTMVFEGRRDELAVTILHELLHFVTDPGDGDPASLLEAEHDIMCYALLGVSIPLDHWAFKKYPHLLDELGKRNGDTATQGTPDL